MTTRATSKPRHNAKSLTMTAMLAAVSSEFLEQMERIIPWSQWLGIFPDIAEVTLA